MAKGNIGSIIETKDIVSNNLSAGFNCIKLAAGYYMAAFQDDDLDGHVVTFPITESSGDIGNTIEDWEFADGDTTSLLKLIKISGTTYAIIYSLSQTANTWNVSTFTVSDTGDITTSFIDTLIIPTTNDEPVQSGADIIKIDGDVYAIVFTESGASTPGVVVTVTITATGVISNAVVDSLDFATTSKNNVSIVRVGTTDFYAIAFTDTNNDPTVVTVDIDSAGTIAAAVTDTQILAATTATLLNIVRVPGTDYYAVAVGIPGASGTIYTCSINSSGTITNGSNGNFDSADAETPHMISIGSDTFLIAYRGVDNDGFLVTITIDSAGAIGSVIESLEFLTTDVLGTFILYLGEGNYAIVYGATTENDFECATVGVATGFIYPTVATTRITSITHRFDRGIYNMELGLGEVVADFGLPEWETTTRPAVPEVPEEVQAPVMPGRVQPRPTIVPILPGEGGAIPEPVPLPPAAPMPGRLFPRTGITPALLGEPIGPSRPQFPMPGDTLEQVMERIRLSRVYTELRKIWIKSGSAEDKAAMDAALRRWQAAPR